MSKLDLTIKTESPERLVTFAISSAVVVGRQSRGDEPLNTPCALQPEARADLEKGGVPVDPQTRRLAVAPLKLASISRYHLLVIPMEDGRFRIVNLSREHPIFMERSHRELKQREGVTLLSEEVLWLGEKTDAAGVVLQPRQPILKLAVRQSSDDLDSVAMQTRPPGVARAAAPPPSTPASSAREREEFLNWFDENMDVFQGATRPEELYVKAAQAVVEMVKLDAGQVLRRAADGTWNVVAVFAPEGNTPPRRPRENVLAKMLGEGRTVFVSDQALTGSRSVLGLEVVAAAPIKDRTGGVIGAVCGERGKKEGGIPRPIKNEEALMLQLLARAVAAALDRMPEEGMRRDVTRLTVYMSKEQAEEVIRVSDWRTGKQAHVSVLFCDLVGSTDVLAARTAVLGDAVRWSGEVLEMLTGCVRESGGTLIDYTGDGLFALWGAPIEQADHDDRACATAVAMADGLQKINEAWLGKIQRATELRIGLNCGPVMVGNIGTREFEKFGAYGEDVNLGKRIESAAKDLQASILVHGAIGKKMRPGRKFAMRRLRMIEVRGGREKFDVYELCPNYVIGREQWDETEKNAWRDGYEEALGLFESGVEDNIRKAASILGRWRENHRWDRPALVLLAHAVSALAERRFGPDLKTFLPK